jgi:hypothetical protein
LAGGIYCSKAFFTSFEEAHTALLSHVWAYFAASLAFILRHWLLFYGSIAQIIVSLLILVTDLAALYYLDAKGPFNNFSAAPAFGYYVRYFIYSYNSFRLGRLNRLTPLKDNLTRFPSTRLPNEIHFVGLNLSLKKARFLSLDSV